ncbi:2-hydroxycarboxylate transporter family protein [Caulobacter sp. 1776]|uniref:2-hydroxycarboxylate transporter family protein n=1 Tax=Caulobacter sp. 1776 TaxID=3156420 RepID=UPI00339B7694
MSAEPHADAPGPLLTRWWALMETRLGVAPLPLLLIVLGLAGAYVAMGKAPSDILANIAFLVTGGFLCAEIGKRIPVLNRLGFAAIFATFAPSYLEYAGLLPKVLVTAISDFTESSNFLYLFIASIVVGSILGMDRRSLITGFGKIFIPLILGSMVAFVVGCSTGVMLGLGFKHTLFKVVAPIMAGGVGEGAIPLSIGYAHFSGQPQGEAFAEVLPPVMLGSLSAVILAGGLNFLGRRFPKLTGEGRLQPGEEDAAPIAHASVAGAPSPQTLGAALLMVAVLYLLGALTQSLLHWPGPVVMLGLAVVIKLARLAPPSLEQGAYANYQFFSTCVTYPLLFAIGVAKTPWEKLISAFNLPTLITIFVTVVSLITTGFVTSRWVGLYPIEAAIVNATHSGQGGTGDVAILTAANRMQLMPFAQIATRIGGAITVTFILAAFARFK